MCVSELRVVELWDPMTLSALQGELGDWEKESAALPELGRMSHPGVLGT
jgi:hypothetical protein